MLKWESAVYLSPVSVGLYEAGRKTAMAISFVGRDPAAAPGRGDRRLSEVHRRISNIQARARDRRRRRHKLAAPIRPSDVRKCCRPTYARGDIPSRNFRVGRLAFVQSAARAARTRPALCVCISRLFFARRAARVRATRRDPTRERQRDSKKRRCGTSSREAERARQRDKEERETRVANTATTRGRRRARARARGGEGEGRASKGFSLA